MSIIENLARPELWKAGGYRSRPADSATKLRLNCNENPWLPLGCTDTDLNRYPEKQPAKLLNRLAEMYQCPVENLLVTRGADDGIDALLRGFCRPSQDSIAQCPPTFVMYEFFARLCGLPVIDVPLKPDGFQVDYQGLKMASDKGAKALFICSPNNPTGSVADQTELLRLARDVQQKSLVVVDEAYIEFSKTESLLSAVQQQPNLVVLRTLSKAWSLAAARLGVVGGCRDLIEYLNTTISPYPLSRPAVNAAVQSLTEEHWLEARVRLEELKRNRDVLRAWLERFDWVETIYPSEGNFLLLKVSDADSLMKFTEARGVILRNQSSQPGLSNHVRITACTREEMEALLDVLREFEVKA